jgi:hypothetical protein
MADIRSLPEPLSSLSSSAFANDSKLSIDQMATSDLLLICIIKVGVCSDY